MSPHNEHIEAYLSWYLSIHSPGFAVLIKGNWGCGKTWFVKDYCARRRDENSDFKYLHLSLYGASSTRDIDDRILEQLYPMVAGFGGKKTGKLASLLTRIMSIRLSGDSTATPSTIELLIEALLETKEHVIIFDDLERCTMPIISAMGYINQFVEFRGCRVIVVANEDKIQSQYADTPALSRSYHDIKEKLIGRTLHVSPETSLAFDAFVDSLSNESTRNFLLAHYDSLIQIYSDSASENLRSIRVAILEFARLHPRLNPVHVDNEPLMQLLLLQFFAYTFSIQAGRVRPGELHTIKDSYFSMLAERVSRDADTEEDEQPPTIVTQYPNAALDAPLVPESIWETFFDQGIIDSDAINDALGQSPYYFEKNTPSWLKLLNLWSLTDAEFESLFAEVLHDYRNRSFEDPGVVRHIVGLLMWLSQMGLIGDGLDALAIEAKSYAEYLRDTGRLANDLDKSGRFLDDDNYAGIAYWGNSIPEFSEIRNYFRLCAAQGRAADLPALGSELLGLMTEDVELYYRRLVLTNSADNLYYGTPILSRIAPKDFVNSLLSAPPDNWRPIAAVFKERYAHRHIAEALLDELPWLRNVGELIRQFDSASLGKLSAYRINSLIDNYILPAIARLVEIDSSTTSNSG